MTDQPIPFAEGFTMPTFKAWQQSLDKILKGAPFDKKMVTQTFDDLPIQPLYTAQNGAQPAESFPGLAPYLRGAKAAGQRQFGWDARQIHANPDRIKANQQILDDLERGADSLILRMDQAGQQGYHGADPAAEDQAGKDGLMVYSVADFDSLLNGVHLNMVTLSLDAGAQTPAYAQMLMDLWRQRGHTADSVSATFNYDPLGSLARTGHLPQSLEDALSIMDGLAQNCADSYPNVRTVQVNTAPYYSAGATETQDIAYALATGVTYLRTLSRGGMDIDQAARQITFQFTTGADFFPTIAKLRAARFLWAKVLEACDVAPDNRAMVAHVAPSERSLTQRDPWVNILRTTASCFGAALGGADSISVLPFDHLCGVSDDFARRIARNTQVILQEESHLAAVIDPAGGSWFIEDLTQRYAEHAWSLFQDIEQQGGMSSYLQSGTLHKTLEDTWQARLAQIATRKTPLTGVSEFPNLFEEAVERPAPNKADLIAKISPNAETIADLAKKYQGTPAKLAPLPTHRLAEDFERLRDTADAYKDRTGQYPKILGVTLGSVARHTARATFAKNFFEAGGIEFVSAGSITEAGQVSAALQDSGASIAVICGHDEDYESLAAPCATTLKTAGCTQVFLAGRGAFDGVDQTIGLGSNLLTILSDLHRSLGV